MKRYHQFTKWMHGKKWLFILGFVALLATQYFRSLTPLFLQHIVDTVFGGEKSALPGFITQSLNGSTIQRTLLLVAVVFVIYTIIRLLFVVVSRVSFAYFMETVAYNMRNTLYDHIQNLSFTYHSGADTGDLIQRTTTDVDAYRRFIGEQLVEVSRLFFLSTFAMVQMFLMFPLMTAISLISAPVIVTSAAVYFSKVKTVFDKVERAEASMTTAVQENVTGTRVVKAFQNEKFEIDKFDKRSETFRYESMRLSTLMAFFWSATDFIIFIQYTLTASFGIYFTIQGDMQVGEFIAFLGLLSMIVWPLRQLGRIVGDFGKTIIALDRIDDILVEVSEHKHDTDNTPPIHGHITFKNVAFQFHDDTKPLLKNINFEVKPGETLAVIGKTGSGKSTLMNLLIRLLEVSDGEILIDGVNIKDINKKHLRQHVGVILQEPFLYSRSVFDNIGIMKQDADQKHVHDAANIARVHDDILGFEQGYNTVVGERGVTLSGGQKQRVAIARMLLENKPVLVFDDSLSAVDTETDIQIRRALNHHWQDTTVFIITHRITTAMEADKIIILEDGEIKAFGDHASLINENGIYASLYKEQTQLKQEVKPKWNN